VDLGIKTFATLSNGDTVKGPDYLNLEASRLLGARAKRFKSKLNRRIRRLQRRFARSQKSSNRRHRIRLRVARLHNRIADMRLDFLHKLSTALAVAYQAIVLEDLNISGMLKNRKLARAISLQGWQIFRMLCEFKAAKYLRDFQVISRWEPTS